MPALDAATLGGNEDIPHAAPVGLAQMEKVIWDNPAADPNRRRHIGDDPTGERNANLFKQPE